MNYLNSLKSMHNPNRSSLSFFHGYNSIMHMSHRYPWELTTHSTPQSKFKYSSPSSNLFSSTSNSYKRVTSFATTPVTKYTYTTASYLYANKYKTKVNNSNDASYSKNGYGGGTTTRKYMNHSYYTVNPISKVTNDLNYPKISPFKHKGTTVSFATSSKKDQNGLQSDARGKINIKRRYSLSSWIIRIFSLISFIITIVWITRLILVSTISFFILLSLLHFFFSFFFSFFFFFLILHWEKIFFW